MNSALTQKANAGTTENECMSNAAILFRCISIGSVRWVFLNQNFSATNNNNNNNVYILLCNENVQSHSYKLLIIDYNPIKIMASNVFK